MKKINIIVPVYNVEKYVEKCIQSLINQSYKNDYETQMANYVIETYILERKSDNVSWMVLVII